MAVTKIYTGAAFVEARFKLYDGAGWIEVPKFYDGAAFIDLNSQGPVVSPSSSAIYEANTDATCFAGVRFHLSGEEDRRHFSTGSYSIDRGDWLDSGLNSEVWVERTINSGSLNAGDAGTGRLVLSTSRAFGLKKTSEGTQSCNITFKFYDAAAGGNELASVTYNIIAEYFSGA